MRIAGNLLRASAFSLLLLQSPSLSQAQAEFQAAHAKLVHYFAQLKGSGEDTRQRVAVAKEASGLPATLASLVTRGILERLNTNEMMASPSELMTIIATALAPPGVQVDNSQDAAAIASVVSYPDSNRIAVAYNISLCAACSSSWVGLFERMDNRWLLKRQLDNPAPNESVHLAVTGSRAQPLLLLYGTHWGDAHNRLDVRLYSIKEGFVQVWSQLDLVEGTLSISGNQLELTSWTALRSPCQEKTQVYRISDSKPKLLKTSFAQVR